MGIVFPWADAPSITRKARLRCSSGNSTPAGEVTISRVELVILLVETYMYVTGTPSWTLTVKNYRASVHAPFQRFQQSSALRGRGPRRSRVPLGASSPAAP